MTKRMCNLRPFHLLLTAALLAPLVATSLQACGSEQVVDQATVAAMEADEFQGVLADATDDLINHLGGDEAGFYAVLLAFDQGYDVYQLLTASLNNRIDAEGRITDSDGSVLAPARSPERIIEPDVDAAEPEAGRLATVSASHGIRLAAVSSSPLVMADSTYEPQSRIAALARSCDLELVHELGSEILREKETELLQALAVEEQAVQAELQVVEEQADLIRKWDFRTTQLTIKLGALGYSVQQILEAILLDNVRLEIDREQGLDSGCWYIEWSPGVVLRPANPPVDVLGYLTCVTVDEDAPTEFPAEDVEAAVESAEARVASSDSVEEGPSTSIVTPDVDGTADGTYLGDVSVILPFMQGAIGSFDDLSDVKVELQVTDDGITAIVEFTERWPGKIVGTDPVCITTVRCLYFGQGPVTNPLSLVMTTEPEIVSIGDKCNPGYEEWLANSVLPYLRELTLVGTFSDGVFSGNLGDRYEVDAAISR